MLWFRLVNHCQYSNVHNCLKLLATSGARKYSSNGPLNVYQNRVASGEFKADEHQKNVVKALQQLFDQVDSYEPSQQKHQTRSWFFRKPVKNEATLKGLYIHGSVGGGKTTLMDLFFDCCSVNIKFLCFLNPHIYFQIEFPTLTIQIVEIFSG